MGVTTSPVDWYAARAAGIVAYVILTIVVLVGLSLSGQLRLPRWPKFAVTEVHRFGGLLVGAFVTIHIATIALDSYTPFSLTQLVVPFTSHYRPLWTALGIVAAELLVAVAVTNALRRTIPYGWWRRIHVLNFVVWGGATVHGIGAGTDTPSAWMTLIYIVSVSGVLGALAWRMTQRRLAPSAVRGLAGVAGLLGMTAVIALAAGARSSVGPHAAAAGPTSFSEGFAGSLSRQASVGGSMLSILGRGTGVDPVLLRIDLVSTDGRSISDTALQVEDTANGLICSGTVSNIGDTGFSGTCSFPTGTPRSVRATWQLADENLSGNLSLGA
jgi:hypothetical protein